MPSPYDDLGGMIGNRMYWRVERTDGTVEEWSNKNLRLATGIDWQVAKMFEATGGTMNQMALTEDTTTPQSDLTQLASELSSDGLSRQTVTVTSTTSVSKVTLTATWQYTGGSTVTLANASVCSNLTVDEQSTDSHFLMAAISPVAVLDSNDTFSASWTVNI